MIKQVLIKIKLKSQRSVRPEKFFFSTVQCLLRFNRQENKIMQ